MLDSPKAEIKQRPLKSGRMRAVLMPTEAMIAAHIDALPDGAISSKAALRADLLKKHGGDLVCPVTMRGLLVGLDNGARARLGLPGTAG